MRWISDRIGNQAKALSAAWLLRQTGASRRPGWLGMLLELGLVIVWGVWFTRSYLPLDSQRIPLGREFLSAIQTHHLWTRYAICGWCALWNGSARGGVPAFVDPHGSMLHPIVALTTVIWGVIQGAKVALVISFALAGVAVWWLAKELGLGRVPRVWSGLMAVVGGHLAFKMELGAFGVILATVMSSFFFPAALRLHREGTWRSVVLLGVVLASAVLAGQGYMQVGLLAAIPALLILLLGPNLKLRGAWKGFLAAAAIAFLLAAPFLVPLLHFLPNFAKEFDPEFTAAQPLRYLPLNLVINDDAFYVSDSLQKLPFPHLNALFIGWIPVILAVIGLTMAGHELRRERAYLGTVVLLEFLVASAVLLRWLVPVWPGLAGIRHPSQIAGLAIPPILGLAAIGLERLLRMEWPTLTLSHNSLGRRAMAGSSLKWLLLVPLILGLREAYRFSHGWMETVELGPGVGTLLEQLQTPSAEWVAPPFGDHFYIESATAMGLKLSPGIMTWFWKDREPPVPRLEASIGGSPLPGPVEQVTIADGIPIYFREAEHYAAVRLENGESACVASSMGGWIKVTCQTQGPGLLVVKENNWVGWRASRDGEEVQLADSRWLEVEAPQGRHEYVFRYLPWDVPIGLTLSALGLLLCAWVWYRSFFIPGRTNWGSSGKEPHPESGVTSEEPGGSTQAGN